MSQSLSITRQPPSMEHASESAARGLQQSQLPLIDALPASPSLCSDDPDAEDDESPRNTLEKLSHNMTMPPQRQSSAEQAPALPVKSSRRASRMLDNIIITQKMPLEDQQPPLTAQSAPHDIYLSSEEDASSSADDFSDFEFESSTEEAQKTSTRRGSQEDTARVVSVVFSGKPSIVNLPRRSMSPSSSETSSRPPSRLRRTSTLPIIDRRVSISSSPSAFSVNSSITHPPRTSSMLPSRRLQKEKPQFLSIDPFASKPVQDQNVPELKTPKTPTGMFKRTLSLVKKRSRPSLNTHFNTNHSTLSRDSLPSFMMPSYHMEQVQEESPAPESKSAPVSAPASAPAPAPVSRPPVTYHEIVKLSKRRAQTAPMSPMSPMSEPASPMTPNGTRQRLRNGFSSARRRSSIRT
ncbi:hypothetical protein AK830_g11748 [Neonectria ditissima]|uniref:Uncharacterized protein n=1 Tax=Neonectria ditissima TaxID=78410 RepID=A0A0P7B2D4_9HYPO|nr:hypothetical protein AK830_g11748 [Neonectria ditissima]